MKKVKKIAKKPSITKLKKKLEDLVKLYCKVRDNWICQKCGKWVEGSDAHGSHVIPVSQGNQFRFDPENIKTLCYHCHLNWWHKAPLESGQWFREKFPERSKYLEAPRVSVKLTTDWLQEKIEEYKNKLESMGES